MATRCHLRTSLAAGDGYRAGDRIRMTYTDGSPVLLSVVRVDRDAVFADVVARRLWVRTALARARWYAVRAWRFAWGRSPAGES